MTITVNEVSDVASSRSERNGADRIKNGFSDTMYDLSEGFKISLFGLS